jgi:hypothetical protein
MFYCQYNIIVFIYLLLISLPINKNKIVYVHPHLGELVLLTRIWQVYYLTNNILKFLIKFLKLYINK